MSDLRLSEEFLKAHPLDGAHILEELSTEQSASFLEELRPGLAAKAVQHMTPFASAQCIAAMTDGPAARLISLLPFSIAAALLRRLKAEKRSAIMDLLEPPTRNKFARVIRYPEHAIGSIMDPNGLTVSDDMTVGDARTHIRRHGEHVFFDIPVIDDKQLVVGIVSIRELLRHKSEVIIGSIMHAGIESLNPALNTEAILEHPLWQHYADLPVADRDGMFLGVLSLQNARLIEAKDSMSEAQHPLVDAGRALGDLYWVGFTAFIKGLAVLIRSDKERSIGREESQ